MTPRAMWKCCLAVSIFLLAMTGCASSEQKQFRSPEAAVDSLVDALRSHDPARLKQVLGPAGDDILSSGDEVADRADVARFLALYDEQHHVESNDADAGDGGANTLIVGDQDWPFPVPIVKSGNGYVFDTESGKEEILNRRIGRNELDAQQVCLAIVDAQREYVRLRPMGGDLPEYARKVASDPGTRNGLYWFTGETEPPSPLGPLVAQAAAQGYGGRSNDTSSAPPKSSRPYHGYRYRLLTAQGPNAPGGAADYLVNGHLVGGFAVVAYPAQYGNSGIMTFITSHDGVLYQRDFGDDTQQVAEHMTTFDPGPGWTRVEQTPPTTAPAE